VSAGGERGGGPARPVGHGGHGRRVAAALAATLALLAGSRAHADDPAARLESAAAGTRAAGETAADDAAPAPVEIRAAVDPDTVPIGTPVRYTLTIAAAPEVEIVLSQPTERLGDFEIVDFGDLPPGEWEGRRVVTRWLDVVGFEPGYHLVRSPPVLYRRPGEELVEAPAVETVITVESLLEQAGDATRDIRDIKGPEDVPPNWRPWALAGGLLAAALALALVLSRVLGRDRRARLPAPPPPPHEVAYAELERLRRRGLVESGLFKDYYSALSDIVRTYVEQRFGLRAPEMTTEEFLLTSARGGVLASGHRALLGEFLTESDLVKFARHVPAIADTERAWAAAKRFVDETAPRAGGTSAAGRPRGRRAATPAGPPLPEESHAAR
jgi:hypothetical protein